MPVDFLTPEQEGNMACFCENPTSEAISELFLVR